MIESEVVQNAAETWVFLSSKDGDLRVRTDCDVIFNKYKPTHVIHLAAKVGYLSFLRFGGLLKTWAFFVPWRTFDSYDEHTFSNDAGTPR